tara:strand:+ start:431 stop:670 length:240 start_codon:yes stop_codon:yes gene_type:complete
MAKRPIYQAKLCFEYTFRRSIKKDCITTFVTTDDLTELNNSKLIKGRICDRIRRKKDKININIYQVELQEQFGETTNRF